MNFFNPHKVLAFMMFLMSIVAFVDAFCEPVQEGALLMVFLGVIGLFGVAMNLLVDEL